MQGSAGLFLHVHAPPAVLPQQPCHSASTCPGACRTEELESLQWLLCWRQKTPERWDVMWSATT